MNERDRAIQRNNVARLFRHQSRIHRGCIRVYKNNTPEHEQAKYEKCMELLRQGHDFITEAEFEDQKIFKKRCDIVDLDEGIIYEIVHSEKADSIEEKRKQYPLPIVVIKA